MKLLTFAAAVGFTPWTKTQKERASKIIDRYSEDWLEVNRDLWLVVTEHSSKEFSDIFNEYMSIDGDTPPYIVLEIQINNYDGILSPTFWRWIDNHKDLFKETGEAQ